MRIANFRQTGDVRQGPAHRRANYSPRCGKAIARQVIQQIGCANVMGPPAHFEQFITVGKIEAAPTELQIQADDNRWTGHLLSNLNRWNYAGEAPIVFPERALRLAKGLILRTSPPPRFAARHFARRTA